MREYDPIIGRWTAVDPKRQFFSPYVGMGNNPVSGMDTDGAEVESPYYDYEGKFLGVDENGFSGEIRVMESYTWDMLNIGNKKGFISSEKGYSNSKALDKAGLSPKAGALLVFDVVSRLADIKIHYFDYLYNREFSAYDMNTETNYNDGFVEYFPMTSKMNGAFKVNISLPFDESSSTVETIQLTYGIHEFIGHGYIQFILQKPNFKHSDVHNLEINHSLFKSTPKNFQRNSINMRNMYLNEGN